MYKFHYNYIGVEYDSDSMLLFTDTGSLGYEIEIEDVYENFYEDKNLFDFSDYPKIHDFMILLMKN